MICSCDRPIPLAESGTCLKCGRELQPADPAPGDDVDEATLRRLGIADYRAAFRAAGEPPDLES